MFEYALLFPFEFLVGFLLFTEAFKDVKHNWLWYIGIANLIAFALFY